MRPIEEPDSAHAPWHAGGPAREDTLAIIYRNIEDVVYQLRVEGEDAFRFVNVNPAFYKATQLLPEQIIGMLVRDVIPEPSLSEVLAHYRTAIATGHTQRWEEHTDYPAGRRVGRVTITPVCDAHGRCTDLVGTVHDITDMVEREARLQQAHHALEQAFATQGRLAESLRREEERLVLALDGTGEGVWDWRIDEQSVSFSGKWKEIMGFTGDMDGATPEVWRSRIHPDDTASVRDNIRRHFRGETPYYSAEYAIQRANGEWIRVRSRGSVVERDAAGQALRMIGTTTDITESHRVRQALAESHQRLAQLARQVPGALFELVRRPDGSLACPFISEVAQRLFGLAPAAIQADLGCLSRRIPAAQRVRLRRALEWSGVQLQPLQTEFQVEMPNGELCWREVIATPTRGADGATVWYGFSDDISGRKRSEDTIRLFTEKLERRANYDTLTGLPNRALFRDRLEQAILRAEDGNDEAEVALLFIDLDRFKGVNDLLGHDAGDLLLAEAARRIQDCVLKGDTVARLGGDEFTVILTETRELAHVGALAQGILDALARPFQVHAELIYIGGSIGIARFPSDAGDPDELMRNADHAMYRSKAAGRNQLTFFEANMQAAAIRRLKLLAELRRALPDGQLELCFQPIVDLATGQVAKAEALLRWRNAAGALLAPDSFIDVAEESGLIHEIGDWVFRTAADHAKRWSHLLGRDFQVSINKSPVQFQRQPDGTDWVAYLEGIDLGARCINVEITEGLLLNLSDTVLSRLAALQASGMQVSIDDFGTGYSSMSYLKRLDIDYLKIDQSFIKELEHDNFSRTITDTIIVMAHKLGLKVIAEGVETAGQRDCLLQSGCDFAQGFLFSRPLPADQFEALLRR
ncbi:sensor domain-containing protein [Massilia yuzhufengensis]|uniref:PAS domain S-box-containing protein/diguanylate cyclase (GGDEF) domain-containing protein n=1 Tax=Massilia yuzhufengensis TaxID=1164594 RepID=A0A1I1KBU8_9BURK|nr:EAL domain-containing protein [Massilia yuzhufengensis]SFC55553.1 PAS domain S-box-containing protein/diguanylate cyclase (GGDEF) domain-containing protein [Massilia yuzhufengensis]